MGGVFKDAKQFRGRSKRPFSTVRRTPNLDPVTAEPKELDAVKHRVQHEQTLILRCCAYVKQNYPQAIIVTDYAAGMDLKSSDRMKMMSMRSEDGHPDISIDYPADHIMPDGSPIHYAGLRLEGKRADFVIYNKDKTLRKMPYRRKYMRNGKPYFKTGDHLAEQEATLKKYRKVGFYSNFFRGYDEFVKIVDWYFGNPSLF